MQLATTFMNVFEKIGKLFIYLYRSNVNIFIELGCSCFCKQLISFKINYSLRTGAL